MSGKINLLLTTILISTFVMISCSDDEEPTKPVEKHFFLLGTNPWEQGSFAAADMVVTVTFSENIDPSTVTSTTFSLDSAGSGVMVAGTISITDSVLSFTPGANLDTSVTYFATVSNTGLKSSSNKTLETGYSWEFTVGEAHPSWTLLVEDTQEDSILRDIRDIYARNSQTMLEFLVRTNEGWSSYSSHEEGIDLAFFMDTDTNSTTGRTTVDDPTGGTLPINDIGADYRIIVGLHGDNLAQWTGSQWTQIGSVDELRVLDNSHQFEVGVLLTNLGSISIFDLVAANYTYNKYTTVSSYDWAPNQGQGHATYSLVFPLAFGSEFRQYKDIREPGHRVPEKNPFD